MKTHELAKALSQLGKLLRGLPDQDLEDLVNGLRQSDKSSSSVGVSLSLLASLSKYNKSDWEQVVRNFELPVEIRPRDAARDIMGKILTYLAENDEERARVALKANSSSKEPSELTTALKYLLSHD